MSIIAFDRANVTSNSTGTGTIALDSAVSGYVDFANVGHDNQIFYTISLPDQSEWEVGVGTVKVNTENISSINPSTGSFASVPVYVNETKEVYLIPYNGTEPGQKISQSGVVSTFSLLATGINLFAWSGGVLSQIGDIHFVPFFADRGQKVNVRTGAVSTYSLPVTGDRAYSGGALTQNGDVHFVPFNAPRGTRINGITGAVSTYSIVSSTVSYKYVGGVLAPTGEVYFTPNSADHGAKLSRTGVYSTYAILNTTVSGGVLAQIMGFIDPDGQFVIPRGSGQNNWNKVNPVTGVVTTFSWPFTTGVHWMSGVLTESGDVYVASNINDIIVKFSKNSVLSTFATGTTNFRNKSYPTLSANGSIIWGRNQIWTEGETQWTTNPSYTLERNLVIASSNTDNLVNFSAGTKYVFSGTPASALPGTVPTADDLSIGPDLVAWKNYQRLLLKHISAGSVFRNPISQTFSVPFTEVNGAFAGGVLNQNGDIHFAPLVGSSTTNNTGTKLNYISGLVSTYALVQGYDAGTGMHIGGVLAPNGDVHFAVFSAPVGQKVSIAGVVSTYTLASEGISSRTWYGGVIDPNGDIHFVPSGPVGQKVNTRTGAVSTYSLLYTTSNSYGGGVLAPNGDIHFVPRNAAVGQKIAVDGTISTYSLIFTTRPAYFGGVLAPNGDIHFVPGDAQVGQKVNGITGAVSTYSLIITGDNLYAGGVLGPDGEIYFLPDSATVGQRVNGITGVVSTYSLIFTTANAYFGGVLAPNGGIYLPPYAANRGLAIFPGGRPFDMDVLINPFFSKW